MDGVRLLGLAWKSRRLAEENKPALERWTRRTALGRGIRPSQKLAEGANVKQHIRTFLGGVLLVFAFFGAATAETLEDAKAAAERGDFATELQILLPLAARGNADAQFDLGVMYAQGHGVAQDDVQAVAWLRKAADQGTLTRSSTSA